MQILIAGVAKAQNVVLREVVAEGEEEEEEGEAVDEVEGINALFSGRASWECHYTMVFN